MSRVSRSPASILLCLALALVPRPGAAQASVFLNAVGYGVSGATFGALATSNATCEGDFICIPTVTVFATLGGGVLGSIIGGAAASKANRQVAEGHAVGSGRLGAISVGTVLGGAMVGLIASSVLIKPEGAGTILGSDEQTAAIFAIAGAGLAVLQLHRNWGRLTGAEVEARPAIVEGRPGVVAHIRF